MSNAKRDANRVTGLLAETNDANRTPTPLLVDPVTKRLLVDITFGGIDADIIPELDDTYDLGSTSKRWAEIWGHQLTLSDSLTIDSVATSGVILDINLIPSGASTAKAITIDNTGVNASSGDLLAIHSDASLGQLLYLDVDGESEGLVIDSEATTGIYGLSVYGQTPAYFKCDISGGDGIEVYRNLNEAGGLYLALFTEDHTANTSGVMKILNDGSGVSLFIDQNGNGIGLNIDSESTSASALTINGTNTSGYLVNIDLAPSVSSTAYALRVANNSNSVGSVMAYFEGNSTQYGVYILQVGTLAASRYGLNVIAATAQTTGGLFQLYSSNVASTIPLADFYHDGNGNCLNIITLATSADTVNISAVNTSGIILDINLTPGAASTAQAITIDNTGTPSTGNLVAIHNDGVGNYSLYINQDTTTTGASIFIDSEATTDEVLYIDTATTTGDAGSGCGGLLVYSTTITSAVAIMAWANNSAGFSGANGLILSEIDDSDSTGHCFVAKQNGVGKGLLVTNALTGDGIMVDQNGNGLSLNIDTEATSAGAILISSVLTSGVVLDIDMAAGGASTAQAITIDNTATASTGILVAIHNDGAGSSVLINQDGNGQALSIDTESSGFYGLEITAMYGLHISQDLSGGYGMWVERNINEAGSNYLIIFTDEHASNTSGTVSIRNDGTGNALLIDQNSNGNSLYIDKDVTVNATRTWAMKIDSDNAGTGAALGCGIDMSSFSVDEPLLKVVADAQTGFGIISGQYAVDVGGVTYYVPYMQHLAAPSAYTITNVTTDRTYDANSTTIDELSDILGTLLADLKVIGVVG